MERFDWVVATFAPKRMDDLKPEAKMAMGMRGSWQASWLVDEGPYSGQMAMVPSNALWKAGCRVGWVPLCDLFDVVPEG
jgi:hypothetical protein